MSKTDQTELLADRLLRIVKDDGHDLRWLSRSSGIPYSTLRSQLIYQPHRLTAASVFAIAGALGRDVSEVVQ